MVRYVMETEERGLRYQKLDQSLLGLVAISNASLPKNGDLSSQLGHIILGWTKVEEETCEDSQATHPIALCLNICWIDSIVFFWWFV